MKNNNGLYEIINLEGLSDQGTTVVQVTAFIDDIEFTAVGSARRHPTDRNDQGLGYMLAVSRATARLSRKISRAAEQRVIRNDAENRRRREALAKTQEVKAAQAPKTKKVAATKKAAKTAIAPRIQRATTH